MYQVIIIEDDPMVASINKQYVELTPSFRVIKVFKSGIEALEYLNDEDVDLIILDYYTPLMNGAEFIDRLHATGKAPSIIMVTSASDTDIVVQLLSRGVIDYLVKPFEYPRFQAALAAGCKRNKINMQMRRSFVHVQMRRKNAELRISLPKASHVFF